MKDTSNDRKPIEEQQWECGWDDHEALQRRRLSCLSLPEKLLWLEQAHRMVIHLKASRHALAANGDIPRK
jgi:hypothetical protein